MSTEENKQLEEAVTDLVLQILQRGRLNQQEVEGKLTVRDMGVNMAKIRFVQEIMTLAKTEAIALADQIIGKERSVEMRYLDINDEDPTPNQADLAVVEFQREQRLALATYQNPNPVMHVEESPVTMMRVNPNKPAMELVGVTGREQFSENEE